MADVRVLGPGDAGVLARVAEDVFDPAVDDGRVVGFASGVVVPHPDKPAQLFVNEVGGAGPWRRRGLGRAILRALFAAARARGCVEAWVVRDRANAAAAALYRAAGGVESDGGVMHAVDLTAPR